MSWPKLIGASGTYGQRLGADSRAGPQSNLDEPSELQLGAER